jgi:hypothetical protein
VIGIGNLNNNDTTTTTTTTTTTNNNNNNVKTRVITVIIGADRTISKSFRK